MKHKIFQSLFKEKLKFIIFAILGIVLTFSLPLVVHGKVEQPALNIQSYCTDIQSNCLIAAGSPSSGELLLQQGMDAYKAERFATAVELWEKAIQDLPKNSLHQALALNYLSLAYQQLDQWQPAQEAISKSLNLLNSINSQEKLPILGRSLTTWGRLQLALGNPQLALDNLQKATETYEKLGDEEGKISSLINQAQALQDLGYYRQSLKTLESVNIRLDKQPDTVRIYGLLTLGNSLRKVGDLERSWCVLNKGLTVAKQTQSPQATANIYLSLGDTARILGNKERDQYQTIVTGQNSSIAKVSENCNEVPKIESNALGFYRQAQVYYRQAYEAATTSSATRIQAALQNLNVSLIIGAVKDWKTDWISELEKAYTLLPQLQAQISDLAPSRLGISSRIILAQYLTKFKQWAEVSEVSYHSLSLPTNEEIERFLQTAIQQARDLKDYRSEAYALGYLGNFYEENQIWVNARNYTEAGLNKAQSISASDITYQWQWQLGRILKAQGDKKAALTAYIEAVNSLQEVRQNLVAIDLNLTGIQSDFQFDFQEKVEPVYRQLFNLLLSSGEDQENFKTALAVMELFQVAELETFLRCRLLPSNQVQKFKTVEETKQALEGKLAEINRFDPTAALIYPIILDDRIEVVVAFPDQSIKHYSSLISKEEVEKNLFNLRHLLTFKKSLSPEERIQAISEKVYQWLLKKPEPLLAEKKVKTLVFVLDGSLRNIAMPALYNPDKKEYLVNEYAMALSPGLLQLNLNQFDGKNLKILLAGRTSSTPHLGFPQELPAVQVELIEIQKLFSDKKLFFNESFIWKNVIKSIRNSKFSALHIATHGKFSSNRQETYILDFDDQPLNMDNLNSLFQGEDPIELLTFSACETAEGDNRAVLGLAGLAVKSQALSTLAGLWKVDDKLSAELMLQFYAQLKTSRSKAEALNNAQKNLSQASSEYNHPSFWSPYMIIGNWL